MRDDALGILEAGVLKMPLTIIFIVSQPYLMVVSKAKDPVTFSSPLVPRRGFDDGC